MSGLELAYFSISMSKDFLGDIRVNFEDLKFENITYNISDETFS